MEIYVDYLNTCVMGKPRNRKDVPKCIEVLNEITENGHDLLFIGLNSHFLHSEAWDWVLERELGIGMGTLGYEGSIIKIDDEGIGCPLIQPSPNDLIYTEPYVDWDGVRDILVDKGIIINK